MTVAEYIQNPCRLLSIPYWKHKALAPPPGIQIIHDDDFTKMPGYADEPYFRLFHSLAEIPAHPLPAQYAFATVDPCTQLHVVSDIINACYAGTHFSADQIADWTCRPVFRPELWVLILDRRKRRAAALGIAELDPETGEGALEWIQVLPEYRKQGLGKCVVSELLRRLKPCAAFATVSGQVKSEAQPERLYRACGFTGNDIWHVLRTNV